MKIKFILLIPIFILTMVLGNSQAVYVHNTPFDLGIGLRGDVRVFDQINLYGSASYGNWMYYKRNGLSDHFKLSVGLMKQLRKDPTRPDDKFFATIGINRHWVNTTDDINPMINPRIFEAYSFEVGFTVYTHWNFALGLRTDIPRWEPGVDLGLKF